jgi:antitoxin component YwqK of YwqJK toxin-antitoxin module
MAMLNINITRFAMAAMLCALMPSLALSAEVSQAETALTDKFDYFDDGKVMSCSKIAPDGRLVEKNYYDHDGKISKIEQYDASGEKIEESHYDENGKLDDSVDGWAARRWAYKDGKLRVESIYGEDGHLTERKIYNESGDLVDRQYVGDGNIDPNEEFNRGSVVTKETDQFYDEYGNETGSMTTEVDDPEDLYVLY